MCGASLRWRPRIRPIEKVPQLYASIDYLVVGDPAYIMANNSRNLLEAVATRVFLEKHNGEWRQIHRPTADVPSRLQRARTYLARLRKRPPLSDEEFLLQCNPEKRELYRRALEELVDQPLNARDLVRKAFVKVEKYLKPTNPRVIQAANARLAVTWGKFIQSFESSVFRMLGRMFGYEVVMKGKNLDEVGSIIYEYMNFAPKVHGILLDAVRFDGHFSVPLRKWVHDNYRDWIRFTAHTVKIFNKCAATQLRGKVVAKMVDGKIAYEVDGILFSGDFDTGLAAVLVVCCMFYCFMFDMGFSPRMYRFIDNGDDCILFLPDGLLGVLDHLPVWMQEMGFVYRVDAVVDNIHEIRFCQTFPIYHPVRQTWTCCRDPLVALRKDVVSSHANNADWADNFHSIALGGLALFGDMPIFQSYYRALLRQFPAGKVKKQYLPWNLRCLRNWDPKGFVPSPQLRSDFHECTGIPPDAQIELESLYDNVSVVVTEFKEGYRSDPIYDLKPFFKD